MVPVYSTHSATQAHLVKGLLSEYGIDAWVTGDYLQGGVGELQAIGFVQVQVNPGEVQRAKTLVAQFESNNLEIDEQTLTEAALNTPADETEDTAGADRDTEFREAFNNKLLLNLGWIILILVCAYLLWSMR